MNAFSFGTFVKQAIKPMQSGIVSPNLGMDKAKFVPPPKQNVQLPTSGKYNYQTRGGLVTNINGQAVPMNDEQKSYLAKIDDVRRRMDSSNLLGDDTPSQPPAPIPPAQSMLSRSRPAAPAAPQATSPQDMLSRQRVQQVYADRAAAMKRQGLNANNPADLAKFKGGRTGPLPPSNFSAPGDDEDPFQEVTTAPKMQPPRPPSPPPAPRPAAPVSTQRRAPMSMLSSTPLKPPAPTNVTTTKVDGAALARQAQQLQKPTPTQQSTAGGQSMFQKMVGNMPSPSAWTGQTGSKTPGALSSPMSGVSTSFNNATGQQDPPHIITTDNGRKFNTQTKTFLDGRPGGFAQ